MSKIKKSKDENVEYKNLEKWNVENLETRKSWETSLARISVWKSEGEWGCGR